MSALIGIAWAAALLVSILGVYLTWGNIMLVQMFPEGRRWWMPWTRLASLVVFAVIALIHPFGVTP